MSDPSPEAASAPPLPGPDFDAPLEELSRDALTAFLSTALLPAETLALVKRLGLARPGFRPEALGEVERCDLLSDEIRADPAARQPVLDALRGSLEEPAFASSPLDEAAAEELLEVAARDHGLALALWRLLADPQPALRARAARALEELAGEWFGPPGEPGSADAAAPGGEPPEGGEEPARPAGRTPAPHAPADARLAGLEERLRKAEARADEARRRGDAAREKLQGQLREARADQARAEAEAARAREAAAEAGAARTRAEAALESARATDEAAEGARLRGALRDAETRLHAAEGRAARLAEREAALDRSLREAAARVAPPVAAGADSPAAPVELEGEEPPATWLLPVFTDEFYASLEGWDRRIQRAALKQAFLLSQDHRHPSLRALPLEGLPGYYRVRVATDVRLIYRRRERQDAVEICSLIDREDLDRYVRQAKTR